MPIVSMFYGIIIYMYYRDNRQHHLPHIHTHYQGKEAVVSIPEGKLLDGEIPPKQFKMVQAWIAIHEDELMANWEIALKEENIFKIEPLR